MRKLFASAAAVLALSAVTASAADLGMPVKAPIITPAPSPWDIAFGSAVMTDYIFRGITQSAHRPSVAAYFEPRYNINSNFQLYAGLSSESIDFPNHAAAEVDFYGGIRPTFGSLALDLGVFYYYYPGGAEFNGLGAPGGPVFTPNTSCTNLFIGANGSCNVSKHDVSFFEAYAKGTYTFNDFVAVGGNFFYSPSWLNTGAYGTYASGTLKLTAPGTWLPGGVGAYLSGEFGHYWFGVTDAFYGVAAFPGGIQLPEYNTWNVGVGFTWKVFTLDVRYYDTDLSRSNCDVLTGDHSASFNTGNITAINPSGLGSSWCGQTVVAKLSADLTFGSLKP